MKLLISIIIIQFHSIFTIIIISIKYLSIIGEVSYFIQELIYFDAKNRNMSLPLINKLTLSNSNPKLPKSNQNTPDNDNKINKIPVASILLCNTASLNTVDLSGSLLFLLFQHNNKNTIELLTMIN